MPSALLAEALALQSEGEPSPSNIPQTLLYVPVIMRDQEAENITKL
jgi:hypothetical protein